MGTEITAYMQKQSPGRSSREGRGLKEIGQLKYSAFERSGAFLLRKSGGSYKRIFLILYGLNIRSMYSDIDLDANDMETELQTAFEQIMWFVNAHLANVGAGDFFGEDIKFTFNRDILINESEAIDDCVKSVGILSDETIVEMHPWVDDPAAEMEKLKKQRDEAEPGGYGDDFHKEDE